MSCSQLYMERKKTEIFKCGTRNHNLMYFMTGIEMFYNSITSNWSAKSNGRLYTFKRSIRVFGESDFFFLSRLTGRKRFRQTRRRNITLLNLLRGANEPFAILFKLH